MLQVATTYYTQLMFVGDVISSIHTSRKGVCEQIKPKATNEMKVHY